jgi:hypothetical protein
MNQAEALNLSDDIRKFSSRIVEWKRKYVNIYYHKVGGKEYIFRLLTKSEYLSLYFMQFHISSESEDILLEKCILYPDVNKEYLDNLYAGEFNALSDIIISLSGFSGVESIKSDLEKEREKISLLDNQIVLIICKAFPHINPSDIDNFDYPTIIHHVTLAEELLGTKLEISKLEDKNKIDFDKENKEHGFAPGVFPRKPNVKDKRR